MSNNRNIIINDGASIASILFVVLLLLKLTNLASISWFIVFLPLIWGFILMGIFAILLLIVWLITEIIEYFGDDKVK